MFPAWTWTRMQSAITIGVSYTERLALNLARKQRELIRSDKYQRVFGLGKLKVDQDLKGHYENEQGGARISFGTGGTTGYHAHFLIVDDPLNPNEAASETELRSCNDWMDSTLFTRKVDKEVSATILIMQRLHQADPTQHMLDRANDDNPIKHIRLPGELVAGIEPVPVSLREHYVDGLLDVHRLKRRQLAELRIKLGDYGYASQILQVPVPPEGGTFIVERFRIAHPTVTIVRQARFWDKAATPGKGDWCAGVLVGRDINNAWWVLDVRRGRWDTHTREQVIRDTAERDGAATLIGIEQEPGSGGVDSAWMTISNLDGFNVRAFRSTGSKVERATPVSVQVNARNFLIAAQASWLSDFISELHHFPFGLHDDQVDALAGAFNMLAGVGPRKRAGALMRRRVVRPPSPDDRATTIQA
jgi:predicted phage terminase large subunit-like protein